MILNQRYYYNPVTSKLEPIGFDGFSQGDGFKWAGRVFMGQSLYNESFKDDYILTILFKPFFPNSSHFFEWGKSIFSRRYSHNLSGSK